MLTYTRLWRLHCGCFKASLTSFMPSSPKMLSAKHKCVNLLLLMRARERSSQPATVRPQLSKLKEKHSWEGISQIPKFMFLILRDTSWYIQSLYLYYRINLANLQKLQMPLQLYTRENRRKIKIKISIHEEAAFKSLMRDKSKEDFTQSSSRIDK